MDAMVTKRGLLDMQVCVPRAWSDDQIKEFADQHNPCGTELGWHIRRQGDELLGGAGERVGCVSDHAFVHVMLDA